ncbi:MAG: hypothetical protein WCW01_02160 [Gammaproteobacteria bacterium]
MKKVALLIDNLGKSLKWIFSERYDVLEKLQKEREVYEKVCQIASKENNPVNDPFVNKARATLQGHEQTFAARENHFNFFKIFKFNAQAVQAANVAEEAPSANLQ